MRLIDADALNERMYHDAFETDSDMQKWDSGCWIRYKMFERAIEDAPTIKERKTGKWIKEYWNGEHTRKCSACNITQTVTTYRGKVNFNYCPYCGADMRGEHE